MRVGTFNLLHGMSLADQVVSEERLVKSVAALDCDVLGLQEVDRRQARSHGVDQTAVVAQALSASEFRFAAAVVGTPGESFRPVRDDDGDAEPNFGVGLVSRLPVLRWRVVRLAGAPVRAPLLLPGERGMRVMMLADEPRVLLAAVVEGPWGPMTVAATHLSFVPGWNLRQLRTVVRALRELPGPRVLVGDLNLPPRPASLVSGWRVMGRAATYPSPAPRVQLDHVLVDPRDAGGLVADGVAETPVVPVSDHRPLVVRLRRV